MKITIDILYILGWSYTIVAIFFFIVCLAASVKSFFDSNKKLKAKGPIPLNDGAKLYTTIDVLDCVGLRFSKAVLGFVLLWPLGLIWLWINLQRTYEKNNRIASSFFGTSLPRARV